MIKELMHDPIFLAGKSEIAAKEDLPVAQNLLDTLMAHKETCVGMAANMIGAKKCIIAFLDESGRAPVYTVMLNHEIIKKDGAYDKRVIYAFVYFRIFVRLQITGILCSFLILCFASSVPLLKAFTYKVATIASRFNVFSKNFFYRNRGSRHRKTCSGPFAYTLAISVVKAFRCPSVGSFSLPFFKSVVMQCNRNHPSAWNTNCNSYSSIFLRCAGTDSSTASA